MQNKGLGKLGGIAAVVIALGLFLGSQPNSVLGVPNSVTTVAINDSSSGETQIIAASGTNSIYVTHYHLFANGTTTAQWDVGTGGTCGSSTATIDGPMSFIAQTGISAGTGLGAVLIVPASDALCLNLGSSVQVGGSISYQQSQ